MAGTPSLAVESDGRRAAIEAMSRIGIQLRRICNARTSPRHTEESAMPTITPFLWFDTQAEEAMNFYASVFKRAKVISVNRAQGKAISVKFELEGQPFMALNAGPAFTFNESVSFFVGCETQEEIDDLWA